MASQLYSKVWFCLWFSFCCLSWQCSNCLPNSPMLHNSNLKDVIMGYWIAGYSYKSIVAFLSCLHGLNLSLRALKYLLNKIYGVHRRGNSFPIHLIRNAIINELSGPRRLAGYRSMTWILRKKYDAYIPRDTVMHILKEIDPEGTASRRTRRLTRRVYRSQGANATWHIDGYDKLKPYGFGISGCVDGYSRRLMFIEVSSTNNDPLVIAGYYLRCVREIGGCPRLVRTDFGTENGIVASLQAVFRANDTDRFAGIHSHVYGTSTSNQRVEAWWSILRRFSSDWWMDLFKDLIQYGAFEIGDLRQTYCLRYCFMELIQKELDEVAEWWNSHRIRKNRMAECPSGIPDELYFLPTNSGGQEMKKPVSNSVLQQADDYIKSSGPSTSSCGDKDFEDYINHVMQGSGWQKPQNVEKALELYFKLINVIQL